MASRSFSKGLKRSALTVALGVCFAGSVSAQSTSGSIFGKAEPGQTVTIVSDTGLTRTVTTDAAGRYNAASLPAGHYKVTSGSDARDVTVLVASGVQVDFGSTTNLGAVVVQGSLIPAIDVSQTDSRTVFTAEQLQEIAVARDVNAVALLAPGVINSTAYNRRSSNVGSFGGAAASENAYYINGFPVTNPLTNIGSTTLSFDSIAQQQVLLGGYGAEFGRSTGGVISLITKRGTNEWKGGVYAMYTPGSLRSDYKDIYYPDTGIWSEDSHYNTSAGNNPANWTDGKLYDLNRLNKSSTQVVGFYVGGPLVKDRLFLYANAEQTRTASEGSRVVGNLTGKTAAGAPAVSATNRAQAWGVTNSTDPRWTVKLDWNINDDHILEFTGIQDNNTTDASYYGFDYQTNKRDYIRYNGSLTETNTRLYVGKYTGYLTDNLSISAMWGKQDIDSLPNPFVGYDPTKTYVSISPSVVPTAYAGISNPQKYGPTYNYVGTDETESRRFDINYTWGNHEFRAGYDYFEAVSYRGDNVVGPNQYYWSYGLASNPNAALDASHYVGSPASGGGLGTQGYYVTKNYSEHGGFTTVKQKALYIEDRWQITDNILLSLGLRNDGFTNYNGNGEAYVEQKNNWAPRLGFSWDVNGDSTFKVFGNMGRYHLALPNNVSVRGSNPSLSSAQYFTYTGIAADGTPTGLTAIPYTNPNSPYTCANGGMSSNVECGYDKDPRTIAQIDLKPHYQDEFIIGMERTESPSFSWGAKATYRDLKNAIDDICPTECFIFNAGTNEATFWEDDGTGNLVQVTHNFEDDFGTAFPKLKRKYLALDMYAQYQKGDFFGKVDYTLSHNWGNAEGQLNSSVDTGNGGQGDVSVTQDWDLPELMYGVSGSLPNNRTHQIKMIGSYRFADEWRVGGSAIVQSGRPRSCYSYWPYAKPGLYNNAYYSYCGVPGAQTAVNDPNVVPNSDYVYSPRGSIGETPWTATFNANISYMPNWMEGLTLSMDVLNLFNTQTATGYYERSASSRTTVNPRYEQVLYYTNPRSFRFTVRYDF